MSSSRTSIDSAIGLQSAVQRGLLRRRSRLQGLEAQTWLCRPAAPARVARTSRARADLVASLRCRPTRFRDAHADTIGCAIRSTNSIRVIGWRRCARRWSRATRASQVPREPTAASRADAIPRVRGRARGSEPAGSARPRLRRLLGCSRTHIIRDASSLQPGDAVRVTLEKGEIDAR